MNEVNIGYCGDQVFDFIVQCNNVTELLLYDISDNHFDKDIVTGLSKVLPKLSKLKEIHIWNVYMGSTCSEVISALNSPDLWCVHHNYQ